MQKNISTLISFVFHPIFMPMYALFLLFQTDSRIGYMEQDIKNYIYGLITMTLILIPMIVVLALHSLKIINSIYMENKEERVFPLLILSFSAFMTYFFFNKGSIIPNVIIYFIFSIGINAFIAAIVSKFWKISTHMLGIGGVFAFLSLTATIYWIDFKLIFALIVLVSGIVAYARLSLQQHTPTQVYLGFLTGIIVTLTSLFLFIY